jgi:hypothetical protein
MAVSGERHVPAALSPGKTHDTNCTEVWMGHSAGVDECRKSRTLPEVDHRTFQPVACSPQTETRKTEFCSGIALVRIIIIIIIIITVIMLITSAH